MARRGCYHYTFRIDNISETADHCDLVLTKQLRLLGFKVGEIDHGCGYSLCWEEGECSYGTRNKE